MGEAKRDFKVLPGLGALKCFSALQIIWKSSGGSKPSSLHILPMRVLTPWMSCKRSPPKEAESLDSLLRTVEPTSMHPMGYSARG